MAKIIYDTQILDLLDGLVNDYKVYVPAENDIHSFSGQFAFTEYEKGVKLSLNYPVTVLSPKEYLFPAKDILFEYDGDKITTPKIKKQIIFGLSLEDLDGIDKLAKLFEGPVSDKIFKDKFENTLVVGVDKYSAPTNIPFDLYLQEIEDGVFVATANSKAGKNIINKPYFKNHNKKMLKVVSPKDELLADPLLSEAVKKSKDHPVWAKLSETCFGCGICSYVCPLCYCFDMEDEIEFAEDGKGKRCRNWDSCMLKGFADTTHHNFRPELKNRIYNWYFHKFVRMPKEYGFSGCVDCSRCIIYCPAKINYRKVLKTVLEDYKKRPKK